MEASIALGEDSYNGGFLYRIDQPKIGFDVNKVLGSKSPFPFEQEYAVPFKIPMKAIKLIGRVESK